MEEPKVIWKGRHVSGCKSYAVLRKHRIVFMLKPRVREDGKCSKCGELATVNDLTVPLCDRHYAKESVNRAELGRKLWNEYLRKN